jgi:hypothetical protein
MIEDPEPQIEKIERSSLSRGQVWPLTTVAVWVGVRELVPCRSRAKGRVAATSDQVI